MTVTEIGASRTRKEDQRLITGRSRYTDNMVLPGMLHLALLRSPFAHATITALSRSSAASTKSSIRSGTRSPNCMVIAWAQATRFLALLL